MWENENYIEVYTHIGLWATRGKLCTYGQKCNGRGLCGVILKTILECGQHEAKLCTYAHAMAEWA